MIFYSNKGLYNKGSLIWVFWETFQKVEKSSGLWGESTTFIIWFIEKKTKFLESISTELGLDLEVMVNPLAGILRTEKLGLSVFEM